MARGVARSPGLIALSRRRFATPRSAALVIVALTLLAAFLIAAAPRALVGVLRAEAAFQVGQLSTVSRDLTATVRDNFPLTFGAGVDASLTADWMPGTAEMYGALADRLEEIRTGTAETVQAITSQGSFFVYTSAIENRPSPWPATFPVGEVQFLMDPEYRHHLTLVEGEWPGSWTSQSEGPIPLVLTPQAAEMIVWSVGEVRALGKEREVILVGLVEAKAPEADRWVHHPLSTLKGMYFDDGNARPRATGGAWIDPASWPEIRHATRSLSYDRFPGRPEAGGYGLTPNQYLMMAYPVSAPRVDEQDPAELLQGMRELTAQSITIDADFEVRARFESGVVSVLATAIARAYATTATLAVAAVGPVAVSVALIVLAASLIIRRRRGDLSLMYARGTPLVRLRRVLLLEGLLVGVIPAVAATLAAQMLLPEDAGILPPTLAVLIGLVPALALVAVLRARTLEGGRADLDAPVRNRWMVLVELLVLVIAGIAVTMLIFRGVGSATSTVDPLVIVAPMLATVALGLIAVRIHPLWLAVVLRGAQRGKKVVPLVGAARSLRDPTASTTAVLAMLVAVAIAVFSSIVLATVDRGAVNAAERAIGGELSVSGPSFTLDKIEELRAIEGIDHITGIFFADRVPVMSPQGRVVVALVVTDVTELAAVQSRISGGFEASRITLGQNPPQLVASTALAEQLGIEGLTEPFGGVNIVDVLPTLAGSSVGMDFLVMDHRDFAAASNRGFFPRTLVVAVSDGADPDAVAASISAQIDTAHAIQSLSARAQVIQSSPAITALRAALLAALVLAVVLSVIAILLVAGVSRDARSRVIAMLRTMGMSRRNGRGIVSWEFAPLGASALVGGLVLGVVLPLLVLVSIDLRPFTGGVTQPGLTVDPALTASLIATVVVALIVAVFGGVLSARTTSLVTVLRTVEDG